LQVCKFVNLKFYKIKKSRNYKLIITIYNLTNCRCACLQVCKFASLQVYKITKSKNYKLIIIKFQPNKLQVHFCKFACLHVYKIKKFRKLQINNYNFTNCKCTIASSQLWKFTKLQNLEITN